MTRRSQWQTGRAGPWRTARGRMPVCEEIVRGVSVMDNKHSSTMLTLKPMFTCGHIAIRFRFIMYPFLCNVNYIIMIKIKP